MRAAFVAAALAAASAQDNATGAATEPPPSDNTTSALLLLDREAERYGGVRHATRAQLERASWVVLVAGWNPIGTGGVLAGELALLRELQCELSFVDLASAGLNASLPVEHHPLRVAVGDGELRYILPMLFGNLFIIAAFCLALYAAARVLRRKGINFRKATGLIRCPGVAVVPLATLLPGLVTGGTRLLYSPSHASMWMVPGLCVVAAYMLAPYLLHKRLKEIEDRAFLVSDPRVVHEGKLYDRTFLWRAGRGHAISRLTGKRAAVYKFVYGTRIWVSNGERYFCQKYGAVFECFRPGCTFVAVSDVAFAVLLSVMGTVPVHAGVRCVVRNSILTFAALVAFIIQVYWRPYMSLFGNIMAFLITLLKLVALATMTFAIGLHLSYEARTRRAAEAALMLCTACAAVRGAVGIAAFVVDVVISRSSGARHHHRKELRVQAANSVNPLSLVEDSEAQQHPIYAPQPSDGGWTFTSDALEAVLAQVKKPGDKQPATPPAASEEATPATLTATTAAKVAKHSGKDDRKDDNTLDQSGEPFERVASADEAAGSEKSSPGSRAGDGAGKPPAGAGTTGTVDLTAFAFPSTGPGRRGGGPRGALAATAGHASCGDLEGAVPAPRARRARRRLSSQPGDLSVGDFSAIDRTVDGMFGAGGGSAASTPTGTPRLTFRSDPEDSKANASLSVIAFVTPPAAPPRSPVTSGPRGRLGSVAPRSPVTSPLVAPPIVVHSRSPSTPGGGRPGRARLTSIPSLDDLPDAGAVQGRRGSRDARRPSLQ